MATKAPDEGYIQLLEQQRLAIRNTTEGFELDTSWTYDEVYTFLRHHFSFLFQYFEEGPNADSYLLTTPFIVVHKSHQTLRAVPYEQECLDGGVLQRNSAVPRSGLHQWKLFFGLSVIKLSTQPHINNCYSHPTCHPIPNLDVLEQREVYYGAAVDSVFQSQ